MNIHISEQTEARLTEEAQRQGVSVDVYIARLMNERGGSTQNKPESQKRDQPGSSIGQPTTLTVFEQGLGIFGSPEDAALTDEVVSRAYADRRRSGKDQPLAL